MMCGGIYRSRAIFGEVIFCHSDLIESGVMICVIVTGYNY